MGLDGCGVADRPALHNDTIYVTRCDRWWRRLLQVVWLKRDLRLHDHRPLYEASLRSPGNVMVMFIAEPTIWQNGDLSVRHLQFVEQSLAEMAEGLMNAGIPLYTAVAEMEQTLTAILERFGPFRLLAHEEHGTPHTYARDLRVHRWMRMRGLEFTEYAPFGVTRRLPSRDQFQVLWEQKMGEPLLPAPSFSGAHREWPDELRPLRRALDFAELRDVPGIPLQSGQRGGERLAQATFADFLRDRCARYQSHISKPYDAMHSCARISAYLAWGNLSMREVVQRTREMLQSTTVGRRRHLEAFLSRLHWHCHFIQRIEDDADIAVRTMNSAFEGLRGEDEEIFQRWLEGQTGFPLIDAAMRALAQTGWLHFRGRAMVVSFICNTLMHDWRRPAQALAQRFLDYEPGIHFSQVQMQAGTTGFNTIRIYNPLKQSMEHDCDGRFIKLFVPALRALPSEQVHEPWKHVDVNMLGYYSPIVDLTEANRIARERLWSVRGRTKATSETQQLLDKHGSRSAVRNIEKNRRKSSAPEQIEFDFE
jgi:deoxyribodipyrimidine photo-lyase